MCYRTIALVQSTISLSTTGCVLSWPASLFKRLMVYAFISCHTSAVGDQKKTRLVVYSQLVPKSWYFVIHYFWHLNIYGQKLV